MRSPPHQVLLGLGANLGDPVAQLARAVAMLREELELSAVSSVYRSEPVGIRVQPDFYNLVVAGRTTAAGSELLSIIKSIEAALGRTRSARYGPRLIDVDVLAIDDLVLDTPLLTVPHPRLHERPFVLVPIAEIAPRWRHPIFLATAAELVDRVRGGGWVERLGPLTDAAGRKQS